MRELCDLHGGIVPIPQTNPVILALELSQSPPTGWRAILANEMLLYLKRAYQCGHPDAVPDAKQWCRQQRLPVPDWLRDAPDKITRRGKRLAQTSLENFYVDLARFIAVKMESENATNVTGDDKFARARKRLEGTIGFDTQKRRFDPHGTNSTKFVEDSYNKITKHFYQSYYFSPTLLLNWLHHGYIPSGKKRPFAPVCHALLVSHPN